MQENKIIIGNTISEITPEILAELFTNMCSDEQARFFNHVDVVASTWTSPWVFQLQGITDCSELNYGGRRVMQEIGEYSHWGITCEVSRVKC